MLLDCHHHAGQVLRLSLQPPHPGGANCCLTSCNCINLQQHCWTKVGNVTPSAQTTPVSAHFRERLRWAEAKQWNTVKIKNTYELLMTIFYLHLSSTLWRSIMPAISTNWNDVYRLTKTSCLVMWCVQGVTMYTQAQKVFKLPYAYMYMCINKLSSLKPNFSCLCVHMSPLWPLKACSSST